MADDADPDRSQAFEAGLKALWASSNHRTTREALLFEEQHLRFIVQNSPVRNKLNDWDASMILANESRLENISQFIQTLDVFVRENKISQFDADGLIFLFHRALMASFEIGSVCYPSGSAAGKIRDMQSQAARARKSKKKDERIDIARPIIQNAKRSGGKIINMDRLREQVNDGLRALPEKNGKPVTISRDTLERYIRAIDKEAD